MTMVTEMAAAMATKIAKVTAGGSSDGGGDSDGNGDRDSNGDNSNNQTTINLTRQQKKWWRW